MDYLIAVALIAHTVLGYKFFDYIGYALEADTYMDSILAKTGNDLKNNKVAFAVILVCVGLLYVWWPILFIMAYTVKHLERKKG